MYHKPEPKTSNLWLLTAYWRDRALDAEARLGAPSPPPENRRECACREQFGTFMLGCRNCDY